MKRTSAAPTPRRWSKRSSSTTFPTCLSPLLIAFDCCRCTRTVSRAGTTLDLTSTEFNVLETLLRAAGQVLTKEALTEQAMGRKLERHDRAVDMHVSNLRRKLGPGADGEPLIRTVRGVGYLYVA